MEDNSKLFVFERKEVFLILVFVCLISAIAFTLGVRVGKGLSLKEDGFTQAEQKTLDLKSVDEEDVEQVIASKKEDSFEDSLDPVAGEGKDVAKKDSSLDSLSEKFENVSTGNEEAPSINTDVENSLEEDLSSEPVVPAPVPVTKKASAQRDLSGKYTIQLVSRKSRELAVEFAEPFDAAGYDIIINKVEIPTKGIWYRVSIGAFNSKDEALAYMKSEKELFQDKEYIIKQFK